MQNNHLQSITISSVGKKIAIRRKNLPEILDISASTLDGMLNPKSPYFVPDFPKPKRLGKRSVVWMVEEIMEYLRNKENGQIKK